MKMIDSTEIHAFLIGFFEAVCPLRPRSPITDQAEFKPDREYHYYLGGRAAGFVSLLIVIYRLFVKRGGQEK